MYIGQINTGYNHTCVVASDNRAYCWGYNEYGQLGNNLTTNSSVPVAVITSGALAGKTIRSISASDRHTCAIASDNNAYCWGYNGDGRLGNNSTVNSSVPVAVNTSGVLAGKTIKSISIGYNHTCAIASDNNAYCWGYNEDGQLGNNSTTESSVPVSVTTTGALAGKTVRSIATGHGHTCAIASDNNAYCWGYNGDGRLGNNSTTESSVPVSVTTTGALAGKTIRSIATGDSHTCAIASDNQSYCWGYNNDGRLGNGSTADRLVPTAVTTTGALAGKTIRSIATGDGHTCAIASDNNAYCWGYNEDGQLGNNSTTESSVPVSVTTTGALAGKTVQSINAGRNHVCVIASDDEAYCWGSNYFGQLGNSSTTASTVPVSTAKIRKMIKLEQSTFRLFSQSSSPAPGTGLAADNMPASLNQVSSEFRMRLGITNDSDDTLMTRSISAGLQYTCIVGVDNSAYCWGQNNDGQLGIGTTTSISSPAKVSDTGVLTGKKIRQISSGNRHTCVIASDNNAYCWGKNSSGQLGNNSTTSSSVPVSVVVTGVLAGKTIRSISAGYDHTCVIASDNHAYCWGGGSLGQLGNNSTTDRLVPVAVTTTGVLSGKTVNQIAASESFTCAVASDNQAYCWGYNASGRLGDNSTTNRRVPVAVNTSGALSGKTVEKVATSSEHACVIASDSYVYCWGANDGSRLGNGSTTTSRVPVAVDRTGVLAGKLIQAVYAGSSTSHTCAIASDNQSYCWGYNGQGTYGNNTTVGSSTPVATTPVADSAWRSLSLGYYHSCGINSGNLVYCWGTDDSGQLGMSQTGVQRLVPSMITEGTMADTWGTINAEQLSLVLEMKPKAGGASCSTSGVAWSAVSDSNSISFGSAPPAHGTIINSSVNDPLAPTGAGYAYQSIVQSTAPFTNPSAIVSRQTALWDFVLKDRSATNLTDFCFRIVTDTTAAPGTSIDSYSVFPEIKTANGSLSVRFVDNSNNTITNPTINLSGALTQNSTQTVSGIFSNSSNRQIEVSNTASNTGWNLSLAATDGPSTKWSKTDLSSNYPFNSATSSNGQLVIHTSGGSFTVSGTKPNGDSCTSSGMALGSNQGFIGGSVDSITLATMGGSSSFGCIVKLRDIGLNQTIPANQPAGNYILNMTMTVVAS